MHKLWKLKKMTNQPHRSLLNVVIIFFSDISLSLLCSFSIAHPCDLLAFNVIFFQISCNIYHLFILFYISLFLNRFLKCFTKKKRKRTTSPLKKMLIGKLELFICWPLLLMFFFIYLFQTAFVSITGNKKKTSVDFVSQATAPRDRVFGTAVSV